MQREFLDYATWVEFPRSQKRFNVNYGSGKGKRSTRDDNRGNGPESSSILLWNHGLRHKNLLSTSISPNGENKQGGINWILCQHPFCTFNELWELVFSEGEEKINSMSIDAFFLFVFSSFTGDAKCIETRYIKFDSNFSLLSFLIKSY